MYIIDVVRSKIFIRFALYTLFGIEIDSSKIEFMQSCNVIFYDLSIKYIAPFGKYVEKSIFSLFNLFWYYLYCTIQYDAISWKRDV